MADIELDLQKQKNSSFGAMDDLSSNVQGMDGDLKALVAMRQRRAKMEKDAEKDEVVQLTSCYS